MQPLYELYKGLPVMRSEEGTMSESNTKLSYIPIKDKLHHFFRNKGIADLAKSYLGKVSEKQNQIQKLHNGAVRRFLINYNVSVLKIQIPSVIQKIDKPIEVHIDPSLRILNTVDNTDKQSGKKIYGFVLYKRKGSVVNSIRATSIKEPLKKKTLNSLN